MSINTSHAANGVLLYAGEFIILYCNGVTLEFTSTEPLLRGAKKGRIYLTTHRMVFRTNEDNKNQLMSFSFPFYTISNLGLEQPVFGANYIKGSVKPEPSGGFTGNADFKMTFKNGGAIEFGQALMAAGKSASRYQANMPPPPYTPPTNIPYAAAQAYMAPPGPAPYGFNVPYHVFPEQPPANQVYMVEQPPPYPGVMGISQQQQAAYMGANGQAYVQAPAYGSPGYSAPGYPTVAPPASYPQQYPPQGYPTQAGFTAPPAYNQAAYGQPPQQTAAPASFGAQPAHNPNMGPPPEYQAGPLPSKKHD